MTLLVRMLTLLTDRPLCLACLAAESSIDSETVVEVAVAALGHLVVVIHALRACWVCGTVKPTVMVPTRYQT
jgi:hypothetical protein